MRKMLALALMLLATPAAAQVVAPRYLNSNGSYSDAQGVFAVDSVLGPSVSRQETFQLAAANVASAAVTVYGGNYILNQVCSAYGTVAFQALGPDDATYQTVASYTTAATTGGVAVALGAKQVIRVTLTGTTACNIRISRVPY